MKIHNIRFGFATNSSSTHSIVYTEKATGTDYWCGQPPGEFGWEQFDVRSKESKKLYAALMLLYNLPQDTPRSEQGNLVKEYSGTELTLDEFECQEGYIDYQSVFSLPYDFEGNLPDREFYREFEQFLLSDNVYLYGGNDNDEYSYRPDGTMHIPLPHGRYYDKLVCRKDGDHWIVFNKVHGDKVRFSFDEVIESRTR